MRRLLLAALAPLGLAACAGGTLTGDNQSGFYQPQLVGYVSRNGVMPTAVYGAPLAPAAVTEMLAGLEMPAGHQAARFAMTPAAQTGELGRVVLVFDPAPAVADGDDACALDDASPVPQVVRPGSTRVLIAFCYGGGLASEGTLSVPNASPPTVAALVSALNTALVRLLPTTDPNVDKGCGAPC